MDDWDSVSSETPKDTVNNAWDAVSAPQPSLRRRRVVPDNLMSDNLTASQQEASVAPPGAPYEDTPVISSLRKARAEEDIREMPRRVPERQAEQLFIKRGGISGSSIAIIVLSLVVIGLLVFTGLNMFHIANFNKANIVAAATPQTVATATTLQQIYDQATSGTPAVDDPLSDDRNNWGILNTDWGGTCAFTGGAYHLALSKPGYDIGCNSSAVSNFKNFALQVEVTVVQGDYGSIVFGQDSNGQCSIDIHPNGTYALYQLIKNQPLPSGLLRQDFSSAIKQGLNQTNVITIIVNNNQFYYYANKQLLMSYYFTYYNGGGLELVAVSVNQPTDVAFSNLKVWTF